MNDLGDFKRIIELLKVTVGLPKPIIGLLEKMEELQQRNLFGMLHRLMLRKKKRN